MRIDGAVLVVALAAATPTLDAQTVPDGPADRNRPPPQGPRLVPPPPNRPDLPRPPFGERRFGDEAATRRQAPAPRVVCGTTIIPVDPEADRGFARPSPDGRRRFTLRTVRPEVCPSEPTAQGPPARRP